MTRSIDDRLATLEALREKSRLGGGAERREKQHEAGKLTARERVELLGDPGLLRRDRPLRRPPLHRLRHGRRRERDPRRRRRHGLRARRRPAGLRLRAGLHGLRRLALGDVRREDLQGHGPRDEGRARPSSASTTRAARASRKASSRSAGYADIFLRNTLASGVVPQISRDPRPVRGRRRLLARDHGLRPDGARDELDVRHGPRRHQDGHARGRHEGSARRRRHARRRLGRRALRGRLRRGLPRADPRRSSRFLPSNNLRGPAARAETAIPPTARTPSSTASCRPRRTSRTT